MIPHLFPNENTFRPRKELVCKQCIWECSSVLDLIYRGASIVLDRRTEWCVEGGFIANNWALNYTGLTYLNFHKLHQIELIVSKNHSNEGNWLWISLLNLNLA